MRGNSRLVAVANKNFGLLTNTETRQPPPVGSVPECKTPTILLANTYYYECRLIGYQAS